MIRDQSAMGTYPKNLTIKISESPVAKAHGKTIRQKNSKLPVYTGLRPYISLRGAKIRLPNAKPTKYMVTPNVAIGSLVTLNSFIMPGILLV
jgi:hypothetical protein